MDRAMLAEHLVQAECDIVLGESHLALLPSAGAKVSMSARLSNG
jgi:hypothetical protein